ncbi:nitroreductase [Nocardioides insulae]|uniref:nitroreductase n=1 Tax=Nocardioides insulae TaxID=394734 RepID=UPI00048E89CD|nr:nitroreductase [Nocardioides insulae]
MEERGLDAEGFDRLLADRWSCRGFRTDEVPAEVLTDVAQAAQRTASWCNTQPWHTHLVTGTARAELAERLYASASSGAFSADLEMPSDYRGVYQERRRDAGYRLYAALGIAREDREARALQMLENYRFFGAPHVAIVTSDRNQGLYAHIDVGAYVANLMHAAFARGVASCPQAAIAMQSDVVREFLDLPEDRVVVCGVALGYADEDHPANRARMPRAEVGDALTFVTETP